MILDFMTGPFHFLLTLFAAYGAYWWGLRFINWSCGVKWSYVKGKLDEGNNAWGVRTAGLYIAVALLVSVAILAGAD